MIPRFQSGTSTASGSANGRQCPDGYAEHGGRCGCSDRPGRPACWETWLARARIPVKHQDLELPSRSPRSGGNDSSNRSDVASLPGPGAEREAHEAAPRSAVTAQRAVSCGHLKMLPDADAPCRAEGIVRRDREVARAPSLVGIETGKFLLPAAYRRHPGFPRTPGARKSREPPKLGDRQARTSPGALAEPAHAGYLTCGPISLHWGLGKAR
jgi:hypothetical protein